MSGRILKFEELTSTTIDALDRDRTIFIIPFSPLEGHGSHLPVGLDFLNAVYFAGRTAETAISTNPDFDCVICPAVPLGSQLYKQPGSLKTDSAVIYRVARDMGTSLARFGFRFIFLVSGHGAPRDIVALETAARKVSRKFKIQMHNLSGAIAVRFLKGEFIDRISAALENPLAENDRELLKKDFHGGWWETSMMLYLRPELVDPEYRNLPDTRRSDNPAPPYYGSPSKASAGFAEVSMKIMVEEAGDILSRCLSGEDVARRTTSPLHRILFLRPMFKRRLFLTVLAIVKISVIVWIISKLISG